MSYCGLEQNENDAAIISSLLFLMDSSREMRQVELGDIDSHETPSMVITQQDGDDLSHYGTKGGVSKDSLHDSKPINIFDSSFVPVDSSFATQKIRDGLYLNQISTSPKFGAHVNIDLSDQKEESRQLFSRSNSINSQTAICSVEKEPGRPLYPRDNRGNHVVSKRNHMNCIPITIALSQRN